jgi:class 3 adenylate cyclase/tetratricopeptide (TPR) repeat protein
MYCVACGVENSAEALNCAGCGAGLLVRCSRCQTTLPAGARFCPACGHTASAPGSEAANRKTAANSVTERKLVTILFADFAGFTAFSHSRDPEDIRDYMTSVWAQLDGIITAHGGLVEKHIGDAIMAVFGAKQAREEDPAQTVRAALAMQTCLSQLKPSQDESLLGMRIGIHTGEVVIGLPGASGEFTATGDAVNLASRVEQHAPVGGVLISEETCRQVRGLFDLQRQPSLTVKGRPEPIQTYQVLRAKPRGLAAVLRGVEGAPVKMIGRERELVRLQSALQEVIASGEAQMLTIVGEAGIGKSCLLREFQQWVELLPDTVRLFSGRAAAEAERVPFSLMRDLFAARFEIQDSDLSAVAREKLEQGIVSLFAETSNGSGEELTLNAHLIGQLLGLDFSASPRLRDFLEDPKQIRHRAFQSFSEFFKTVSRSKSPVAGRSPVKAAILVAEDIHWADDGSLDLLSHLHCACCDVPLLILCLARPTLFERHPDWPGELKCHSRLDVDPLSRAQSLSLVENILQKASEVPQALRELIVGGAEGIPFYIEELIKMLIDQKVVVTDGDRWHVEPTRLATARVPPSLTGILQARLDSLTAGERLVLQRASVVGRVFWDGAVEHLNGAKEMPAPLTHGEMLEALGGLRRKELIFHREASSFTGVEEYMFRHELLRNVAYESLLKKTRRGCHEQIARWLIGQSGERSGEVAGLIAMHFERADQRRDAAFWFGRAGQQARGAYAPAAAVDHFQKALKLTPVAATPEEVTEIEGKRRQWSEGLVEVLTAQARFAEALEICLEWRAQSETCGDLVTQVRAWNALAFLNERLGKNRASIECAERAEALARDAGESGRDERIKALLLKGWAFYRLSDASAVLSLGEQARQLCLDCGNRHGLATSFKLIGVAHLQLGNYRDADRFFEQGRDLYEQLGDRRNTAAMWSNLGESARAQGDYASAERLYETALAAVRQIGHRESEAIYLTNLSAARLGLRKFQQVESDLREAMALTDGTNFCALSASYSFLAEACAGQGKLVEAFDAASRALDLARESENDLDRGTAWRTLGRVAAISKGARVSPGAVGLHPGATNTAEDCFARSLEVFKKINAEGERAMTLRAWAEFELKHGQKIQGRRKAEEARAIFMRLGAGPEAAVIEKLLQEVPVETSSS